MSDAISCLENILQSSIVEIGKDESLDHLRSALESLGVELLILYGPMQGEGEGESLESLQDLLDGIAATFPNAQDILPVHSQSEGISKIFQRIHLQRLVSRLEGATKQGYSVAINCIIPVLYEARKSGKEIAIGVCVMDDELVHKDGKGLWTYSSYEIFLLENLLKSHFKELHVIIIKGVYAGLSGNELVD